MRFLVDECLFVQIVDRLRAGGHDVIWARDTNSGAKDVQLLSLAFADKRILVSEDRDYGELIFRDGRCAFGVVIAKVAEFDGSPDRIAEQVVATMLQLAGGLVGQCTVIEPGRVRRRPVPTPTN